MNVKLIHNFVDLGRISKRGPLPDKPKRALIFSNYVTPASLYYSAVTKACEHLSIDLDVIGAAMNRSISEPRKILGEYDVVFAQGRSALEALAAGATVMIYSSRAFGPLVTSATFDYLRERNFGIRTLQYPVDEHSVIQQLSNYSSLDAEQVTEQVRTRCHLDLVLDQLIDLYQNAIDDQSSNAANQKDEKRAVACYLQQISFGYKSIASDLRAQRKTEFENSDDANQSDEEADVKRVVEREKLLDQFAELNALYRSERETRELITTSLTWRMRNYFLRFDMVAWLRNAVRWARGLAHQP